jgi:hypothetical protein
VDARPTALWGKQRRVPCVRAATQDVADVVGEGLSMRQPASPPQTWTWASCHGCR